MFKNYDKIKNIISVFFYYYVYARIYNVVVEKIRVVAYN